MEVFQYSSEDEIFLHKKRMHENENSKKKSKILIYWSIFALFFLTTFSIMTIRDTWVCELDEENPDKNLVCNTLRKGVNCKTTVAPPLKVEVSLRINNKLKASAYAFCGWDTAVSEIRFCFLILSILSIYMANEALKNSSKKEADIFCYTATFLAMLLIITTIFDFIQILDSRTNNYNMCNLATEFKIAPNIDRELVDCTYNLFFFTMFSSLISAISILLTSQAIKEWSKTLQDYSN